MGDTIQSQSGDANVDADQVSIDGGVVGHEKNTRVNTDGGAYVAGNVSVASGGKFIGRDFIQSITNIFQGDTAQRDLRNRRNMLERVKNDWVKGVLEKSLYHEVMIDLGLEERTDEVQQHPWDMQLQMPDHENRALSPGTKIVQVFDEMGHAFLILGEPGSGKTTMLLELARDTIARAEQDPTQPIPVVFNLSSWSDPKQSIMDWLVQELHNKYDVYKKIAQPWIDEDDLLLLLDGLDEVKAERREACVKSINDFRSEHGQTQLVVCSRIADYQALAAQLRLRGAILIQPLTVRQIDQYLEKAGSNLVAVREALRHDTELQELAQSPMMLGIMVLAYRDMSSGTLADEPRSTIEARRRNLFDAYIQQVFERIGRAKNEIYTRDQTLHWLVYLAKRISEHEQVEFLIEHIQPDWLKTHHQRTDFATGSRLAILLVFGLGFGLLGVLFDVGKIHIWLGVGLAIGLYGNTFYSKQDIESIKPTESLTWSWSGLLKGLVLGLFFGLITSLDAAERAISWSRIRPDTEVIDDQVYRQSGLILGLVLGVIFGVAGGLFSGLGHKQMKTKAKPNQSIWLSGRNAVFVTLIFGLFSGVFIGGLLLIGGLAGAMSSGPFMAGVIVVGVLVGLIGGLGFGGMAFIKHFLLCFILYRNGDIPWNYVRFLDYAADRIFLRKVGGGYIFIHRMVMEYFASLETDPNAGSSK
jgi:hypothetical protein